MVYKYYLPNENNQSEEKITQSNSVIIIGANGSGKTRLGVWMEQNDTGGVHRIGAQRALSFGNYIQQRGYEQSTNLLLYGNERSRGGNHDSRWGWDGEGHAYSTGMLNDYEYALSALIALKSKQQEEYLAQCKEKEDAGRSHDPVPATVVDKLQAVWKEVFPQRDVKFDDARVVAMLLEGDSSREYRGKDMSDGERVALYLMAQALCVPENKTIIIDEPEIHLHRSIMNKLWTAIENARQDCLFIYITHDTQFAANHKQSNKTWVKEYDGEHWKLEEIKESGLPEQLLLDILGNRKPVLFVEGTTDSYDTKLYSEIYKDYYVIPCGGCGNVIAQTKAMKSNPQLHHLECHGLIDRDHRGDDEIESLEHAGIFTIGVAEVENLFLVEELLEVVNSIMGNIDTLKVEAIKNYIVNERFQHQLNHQICEAIVSEMKYRLSTADISRKSEEEAKRSLQKLYEGIGFDHIKVDKETIYSGALESGNYRRVLSVFNCKSLSKSIGHYFDLDNNGYCDFVIRQLGGERADEIKTAVRNYLPSDELIPTQ